MAAWTGQASFYSQGPCLKKHKSNLTLLDEMINRSIGIIPQRFSAEGFINGKKDVSCSFRRENTGIIWPWINKLKLK